MFNPSPSIHHWDIPSDEEQEEEEDIKEDQEDLEEPTQTDVAIRLNPVLSRVHMPQLGNTTKTTTTHKPLLPLSGMSTTVGTTTTTIQTTTGGSSGGSGTGASGAPATTQSIQAGLHTTLRCHGVPPTSQPGGGGGGGGSGRGGPPAAAPQGVVPATNNVKAMGSLPQIFTGDRLQADNFIEEVKGYLCLNHDVAGFNLPIKKVVFTLTLLKGDKVAMWAQDMGNWIDRLNLAQDDVPAVWDQFLVEFATQFQDSTCEYWARSELEKITMRFPKIDEYITTFKEYAQKAGYTQGNNETIQLFLKGLSQEVLMDIMRPPMPATYDAIKQKAIESTRSQQTLKDILMQTRQSFGSFRGGVFRNFQNQPCHPFFSQGNNQGQGQCQGPLAHPFNSSNAPRWMANQPVAMDLNRARVPNWQGNRGGGFMRERAAQTFPQHRGNQ